MTTVDDLHVRLAEAERLNAELTAKVAELLVGHDVQADILTAIQAELIESDRLITTIARLGDGASALAESLTKIDEQQQMLTRLGTQLREVEEKSATTEDVEAKVEQSKQVVEDHADEKVAALRKERRRATRRVAAILGSTVALLAAGLAYTINSDHHACIQRQVRVDIQVALYRDIASLTREGSKVRDRILAGAEALEGTRVDCDQLYPIHWGDGQ